MGAIVFSETYTREEHNKRVLDRFNKKYQSDPEFRQQHNQRRMELYRKKHPKPKMQVRTCNVTVVFE